MKNKNKLLFIVPIIAIVIFVVLFLIFNYHESSVLNSVDKEWIQKNNGQLIDIGIINNIPLYSTDGQGVINDYLAYVTEQSTLEFNKNLYESNEISSRYMSIWGGYVKL